MKSEKELVEMAPSKLHAYFEDVAKEMAQYEHVVAHSRFTSREQFRSRYSGLGGASLWKDEYAQASEPWPYQQSLMAASPQRMSMAAPVDPLDLEKAKPFIRAVVERMLDLLQSEDNWIKGAVAKNAAGKSVSPDSKEATAWCLIGAQARALHDLSLQAVSSDPEIECQRKRVLEAVDRFLKQAMEEEKGFNALPTFNDKASTEFEDMRLWLKGVLTKLD